MKVNTKYGEMDETMLEKIVHPTAGVVEYYYNKELVHRSAVIQLTGVAAIAEAQKF